MIADDNGMQRHWIFVPGGGLWLVPTGTSDPEAYAQLAGASVLFFGTAKDRRPVARFTPQTAAVTR